MATMACGKAVVATPGGVSALNIEPGKDYLLASTPAHIAAYRSPITKNCASVRSAL